jgi:hypothetical protein
VSNDAHLKEKSTAQPATKARMRVRIGWDGPDGGYEVHGESYPKEGWRSRVSDNDRTFETTIEVEIPAEIVAQFEDSIEGDAS